MRRLVDSGRLAAFMERLSRDAREETRIYFTGGASALLLDWRATTIDVDIKIEPDRDDLLRAISTIKESLELNIELASPGDFIPELPGWRERSLFVSRIGPLQFHHYDFYAQALSKLERRHARDLADVEAMCGRHLIEPARLLEFFAKIEPWLYRYPALDPTTFRHAVEQWVAARGSRQDEG